MDSDPYALYKKQLEYEAYVKSQMANYTDLTPDLDQDPNDSIKEFAKSFFGKSERNTRQDLTGILMDEQTDVADIFCILLELFLYGFNIITDNKSVIFDLTDSTDDLIYKMRVYFKSCGFTIKLDEIFDFDINVNLYRDRSDYYCQITSMPPEFLINPDGWFVLDYRLILNRKFEFDIRTGLNVFKAFYINKERRIFIISFDFVK